MMPVYRSQLWSGALSAVPRYRVIPPDTIAGRSGRPGWRERVILRFRLLRAADFPLLELRDL